MRVEHAEVGALDDRLAGRRGERPRKAQAVREAVDLRRAMKRVMRKAFMHRTDHRVDAVMARACQQRIAIVGIGGPRRGDQFTAAHCIGFIPCVEITVDQIGMRIHLRLLDWHD